MSTKLPALLPALLLLAASAPAQIPDLTPAAWPDGQAEFYEQRESQFGPARAANGRQVVVGTTGARAVRAGLEALNQGGTAADAIVTTAMAQIALAGGAWVSYAGLYSLVYYEADSKQLYHLNACFDIPAAENDAMTIPAQGTVNPNARTALVPGFLAGVQATHERFGRLPFEAVCQPAIHFAEEGFRVGPLLGRLIDMRRQVLGRFPETRRIFQDSEGNWLTSGDHFVQAELAATLRAYVAKPESIYTGAWARNFVAAVQANGGLITIDDMRRYRVIWSEPLLADYHGNTLAVSALPANGGINLVEALQVHQVSGLPGDYTTSPHDFFWLCQVSNLMAFSFLDDQQRAMVAPTEATDDPLRAHPLLAVRLWELMENGQLWITRVPSGSHSDAVVAVDRYGNCAALVHSINTNAWGDTGLFVDGISIPDAASHQQAQILRAGPGKRLPDPTNPCIALRDGEPVLISSSIGSGLHQETMLRLIDVFDHDRAPDEANDRPRMLLPSYDAVGRTTARVPEGTFAEDLLERVRELGQPVEAVSTAASRSFQGYWIGIQRQPDGTWCGSSAARLPGDAVAD